jgi:hypothetical protein
MPKARALRSEVLQLRKELAGTSSQDEFAKWAKVRRTLDKKVAELEAISTYSRNNSIWWTGLLSWMLVGIARCWAAEPAGIVKNAEVLRR